jgi:predicted small metal-binding protein
MANEFEATCDCGWTARGPEDELIAKIQEHAREAHGLEVTPEQALAQARPVEERLPRPQLVEHAAGAVLADLPIVEPVEEAP